MSRSIIFCEFCKYKTNRISNLKRHKIAKNNKNNDINFNVFDTNIQENGISTNDIN